MDTQDSRCRFEKMVSVFNQHEADRTLFKDGRECPWWRRPANSCATVDVVWAGTPCVDVSPMGKMSGNVGPMSLLLLPWIHLIRQALFKVVFHECTSEFDPQLLVRFLGDQYQVNIASLSGHPADLLIVCLLACLVVRSIARLLDCSFARSLV